ncbi:hypothetical protein E5288_WYG015334 [Bos mutus]|uniref:Uncharacterized protein n=1 Tax=Bos mutus TaxID=72004 RepID=A0A6B0RCE1_9CETA|nr:hypothetical protein [Bos mutus]
MLRKPTKSVKRKSQQGRKEDNSDCRPVLRKHQRQQVNKSKDTLPFSPQIRSHPTNTNPGSVFRKVEPECGRRSIELAPGLSELLTSPKGPKVNAWRLRAVRQSTLQGACNAASSQYHNSTLGIFSMVISFICELKEI